MIREAVGFKRTRVGEFHLRLWRRSPDPLLLGSIRRNLELVLVARIADLLAYQVSAQAILVVGLLRRRKGFSPLFDATRGRVGPLDGGRWPSWAGSLSVRTNTAFGALHRPPPKRLCLRLRMRVRGRRDRDASRRKGGLGREIRGFGGQGAV